MATTTRYTINGLIDTAQPVWENLQLMADACSSWVTYDTHTGRYAVIINQAGTSSRSFTDDNIIGPIQVSGTNLTNLYNAIEIEYPNEDIRDQNHYLRLELPQYLRNEYEPDNTLNFSSPLINNQPQAMLVANILLRQSRVDKTITFATDYTNIDLSAGDLIDITTDVYGWEAKVFRIMRIREIEGSDGSLQLELQCLEYEEDVYSEDDISQFLIDGPSGIRSMTSIGVPGTPTVDTITIDSLPTQIITSTVPEGIVEEMEFWAGNLSITGNIANTVFDQYGSLKPSDAATFTEGANAQFSISSLRDGTWIWKTRGINVLGVGPFSDYSGNIAYERKLVTDFLIDETPIISNTGNVIGSNVGSYTGNILSSGDVYNSLMDAGYMISIDSGAVTGLVANNVGYVNIATSTFTPPHTGTYKLDIIFDQNGSGAIGGRGNVAPNYYGEPWDEIKVAGLVQDNTANVLIYNEGSGAEGSYFWNDYALTGLLTLNAGNSYTIFLQGYNNCASIANSTANFTVGWNLYSSN